MDYLGLPVKAIILILFLIILTLLAILFCLVINIKNVLEKFLKKLKMELIVEHNASDLKNTIRNNKIFEL